MSLGILTKFWVKTPVGKLEFNSQGEGVWEMYPTKGGIGTVKIKVEKKYPHTFDILREFGWPTCPEFKPYGMLYKDVSEPKKAEPRYGLQVGAATFWFDTNEKLIDFEEQITRRYHRNG